MTYAEICESVQSLKKKYDESDPIQLCKAMGIILLFQPMGKHEGAIKGFYMKCKRIPTITVNCDLPETIQKIIIAHELGHAAFMPGAVSILFMTSLCLTKQLRWSERQIYSQPSAYWRMRTCWTL